jgi:hypothetical protein
MIVKTGFPEYIESIAIGDSPDFLRENTDLCSLVEDFPIEINLAYLWKRIATDPDTLAASREFMKNFLLDAPTISTEHLIFYRKKIDQLPKNVKDFLKREVESTFKITENLSERATTPDPKRNFNRSTALDKDKDFLQKIADLMNQCESACNYFKNLSQRVGSIYDYSAANTIYNSPPQDTELNSPPPTGLSLEKVNKIPTALIDSTTEAYTSMKAFMDKARSAMHNFVSNYNLEKLGKKAFNPDDKGAVYIGASSPSIFQSTMEAYSKGVANNRMLLGDCFRVVDYMSRYNPFNPDMNIAKPIDKNIGIKTLEVINGEYVENITKIKVNGVTVGTYEGRSFGLSEGPNSTIKLHDESKPRVKTKGVYTKADLSKSELENKARISAALDRYLDNSSLVNNFNELPDDVKAQAAIYGVESGTKEEWKTFFLRMAYAESSYNPGDTTMGRFSTGVKGSMGVFQLSYDDGLRYGDIKRNFTDQELRDIDFNTKIGIRIWEKQLIQYKSPFINNQGMGAKYFDAPTMDKIIGAKNIGLIEVDKR